MDLRQACRERVVDAGGLLPGLGATLALPRGAGFGDLPADAAA